MIKGKIEYGFGKDEPIAPTYEHITAKGNTCKVYICSEWNPDSLYHPIGYVYKVIWESYDGCFRNTEDIVTTISNKTLDDVIDDFQKYGKGRMWVLQSEIVVR